MYKEITHIGCKCRVDENGDCFTCNGKGEFIHRNWRYNNDGYPIVSACGYNKNGEPIQRSIQVHILVAKAFVDGWFKGAEVNHKDFNRKNPSAGNLEWVTHAENIHYSALAGKYVGKFGEENPNYGNHKLSKKYKENPELAKEKQSRPNGMNGKSKKCFLENRVAGIGMSFNCQREAIDYLFETEEIKESSNKENIIKKLKRKEGFSGWHLKQI